MRAMTHPLRTAALYLRISLDREIDGLPIERQREDCVRLAEREGWEVLEPHYVDQSISATDATKVRPAYDKMVEDYKAGLFNAIICYDLDRLTRQPRQMEDWVDAAQTRGLLLKSVAGDVDLTNENGIMIAGFKIQIARSEMVRKSKCQSAAQRQRAKLGRTPKGMRPLGYAVNGDVIPDEAEAVRTIYELFTRIDHPESLRSLGRALSGTQILPGLTPRPRHTHVVSLERAQQRLAQGKEPRPIAADSPWSPSSVLGILRNPRYAGLSTYTPKEIQPDGGRRRTWKAQILRDEAGQPIRGQWDAIVDEETWWQAQNILDNTDRVTNTSGSTRRTHLGSGLYRCAVCGGKVTGGPRGYRCAGHVMRTGSHIDEFVTEVIAARLTKPDVLRIDPAAEPGTTPSGISATISEERGRILRVQCDYGDELIEARDLNRIRKAAEGRIAHREAGRLRQGQVGGLAPILGTADPATAFREASLDVRRHVIDALVTVTLQRQPRGKKGFDPESVTIEWR